MKETDRKRLGDLFKIEEDGAETPSITINGDVGEVRRDRSRHENR